MIRLGLIGCGDHAASGHAIPLARYKAAHPDEIELAAACDLQEGRAQAFCSGYGFKKAYREVEEMLARKLDGCIAVVPVEEISRLGQAAALELPCVVEKPLGASLEQVRELLDVTRATGTTNMVSVNRRFMPFLNQAIEWTRSGHFTLSSCHDDSHRPPRTRVFVDNRSSCRGCNETHRRAG